MANPFDDKEYSVAGLGQYSDPSVMGLSQYADPSVMGLGQEAEKMPLLGWVALGVLGFAIVKSLIWK